MRERLIVLSVLVLAAALPASASAKSVTVRSGPLKAVVHADPWRVTFKQQRGKSLTEAPDSSAAGPAGPIGFRTAAGWAHATEAIAVSTPGKRVEATVATNDAAGATLRVAVEPAAPGIIAIHATVEGSTLPVDATGIGFAAPASEHFYGLGERSISLDQRGQDVENYVSDGPFSPDTRNFAGATIPPQGYRARDDATYYPVPWVLSSRGYGVLLDRDETSMFHLASNPSDAWSIEAQSPALDLRVFAGPEPADALSRFTKATGRQPAPAAPWQFGPWFQTGQPNTVPLADEASWLGLLQKADAPVSVAETQLRYLPCGLDRGNEDYESQRVAFFHQHGLAILTYVNPMVCASYQPLFSDAASAGALQVNAAGAPDTFNSFVGGTGPAGFTVQPVAQFDFTSPAGAQVYATVLQRMIAAGHDGWMEDFGEYTPADTQPRDGTTPAQMHNRFPTTYHCAVEHLLDESGFSPRPIVRFQRSGWTGAAACASDVWGGDPTTSFGYDGLSSAVKQALGIGMSGVSRWGSDIGGYDTLGDDPQLTPELLKRWIEFGSVSGVMRTKSSGIAIPSYHRPQIWEPEIIQVWRRYAKLHTQLYPYILAADAEYRRTGMPLMRALALIDPGDKRAATIDDEFAFGDDLLAAPIVTEGAVKRSVYLPPGRWVAWTNGLRYRSRDGSFHVGRAKVLRGGRSVKAKAPVDELPLYVRSGAILPLLSPDVDTLSEYGKGVVHLEDRSDQLRLLAFPRPGKDTAAAYESDRFVSTVKGSTWTLKIKAHRKRSYRLEAATTALKFRPCEVTLGGRALPGSEWSFDRHKQVLRASFEARQGKLAVSGC